MNLIFPVKDRIPQPELIPKPERETTPEQAPEPTPKRALEKVHVLTPLPKAEPDPKVSYSIIFSERFI